MVVTPDVSKLSGWLNADAESNMLCMVVTLDVSRLSGWLNAAALPNMPYMFVTPDVSKFSGWLNADAEENMRRMVMTLDVSRLSGWLNAAACCRVKREASEEGQHADREAGARGAAVAQAACWEDPTVEVEGRAPAERTLNMPCMVVTPDVSQLDMSALNWVKALKRLDMSVTAETPQLEMGPYVAVAAGALALYSWAAIRKEALSVKA